MATYLGLQMFATYDGIGGVKLSQVDPSGNGTTYGYTTSGGIADPYWRVNSVTDAYGSAVRTSYFGVGASGPYTETEFTFNGGGSTNHFWDTFDPYGRLYLVQKAQDPAGSGYDTVSKAFSWSGNYYQVQSSEPCSLATGGTCPSLAHTSKFDPLGRLFTESTTGNETLTHTYTANDDLVTLDPPPIGENRKQTQNEYDGLGRLSKSCIIGNGATTACNQSSGTAKGVTDAYSYSSAPGLTKVTITRNGAQSRSETFDSLGRLTQKVTPEGGTWNYFYDTAVPGCSWSNGNMGMLSKVTDPSGNTICYTYDLLHRIMAINANGTSCRDFYYDNSTGFTGTLPAGVTLSNPYGRLVEAATIVGGSGYNCGGGALTTDEWFAYDKDGRRSDMWELTPHSTQYYHSAATYFEEGTIKTLQLAGPSLYTVQFGLDGEGRLSTLKDTTHNVSLATGATYFPKANPAVVSWTGTDNDAYTFDAVSGLISRYTFTVGASSLTGALTWNGNGTLKSLATTDGFNAGGTMTCSSIYDDAIRISSFDCGSGNWGQNFSYDPYDNVTKSIITGRNGTSWSPTYTAGSTNGNHYNCGLACTYDADGNVTGDGVHVYGWNEYGKLKWIASSGTPTCGTSGKCITYDAFGRIAETSNGSTWTERWYTQIGETAYMNGATINFAYWPAPMGVTTTINGNGVSYYAEHKDWLGTSRVNSNIASHVYSVDRAFTPYGEEFAHFGGTNPNAYFFGGMKANFNQGVVYDTDNRELSIVGRWLSPDPANTGWNQYAYPTNPNSEVDPSGLCDLISGGFTQSPNTPQTQQQQRVASQLGANLAFPFSGQSVAGSLTSAAFGSAPQEVLRNAIISTVNQSAGGTSNLFLYSGSAGLFQQVYPNLPSNIQNGITSVTYFSPGAANFIGRDLPLLHLDHPLFGPSIASNVITGNPGGNTTEQIVDMSGLGLASIDPGTVLHCGHDANCEFGAFNSLVQSGIVPSASSPCPAQQTFTRQSPTGGAGGGGAGAVSGYPGSVNGGDGGGLPDQGGGGVLACVSAAGSTWCKLYTY